MRRHFETTSMREETMDYATLRSGRAGARWCAAAALALGAILAVGESGFAQQASQEAFSSAEAAGLALYSAVERQDEQAIIAILGVDKDLVSVGDEALDKLEREQFAHKYREMHRVARRRNGLAVLYIGAENWPFPIPLVSQNDAWHFDADAGQKEVLARRIGANELAAIETCRALVAAQKRSDVNPKSDSFSASVAALLASFQGGSAPEPFHGYYFRILKSSAVSGAALHSSHSSKDAGGAHAFIAYPAVYRSSGVVTFIIGGDDVVYEKDLGPETADVARAITTYSRDSTWYVAPQ
jgi:hypothetical protein